MKLKIKKEILLDGLNKVSKALSTKNLVPVLAGIKFDLTETIKNELDANNIEIPFNQLVVHVEDSNADTK